METEFWNAQISSKLSMWNLNLSRTLFRNIQSFFFSACKHSSSPERPNGRNNKVVTFASVIATWIRRIQGPAFPRYWSQLGPCDPYESWWQGPTRIWAEVFSGQSRKRRRKHLYDVLTDSRTPRAGISAKTGSKVSWQSGRMELKTWSSFHLESQRPPELQFDLRVWIYESLTSLNLCSFSQRKRRDGLTHVCFSLDIITPQTANIVFPAEQ